MLNLSASLKEMATTVARKMLRDDVAESTVPEMPSFSVSRAETCPDGYVLLGTLEVENVTFYVFQMF